jgi:hypothetical protein
VAWFSRVVQNCFMIVIGTAGLETEYTSRHVRSLHLDDNLSTVSKKAGAWRCDMMPIEVCIYCSRKIDEKEKSVNLSTGVAHLACAQKATTRTKST